MRNSRGQYTKGFNNQTGRKRSPEARLKMRLAKLGRRGALANNWRGGIYPENMLQRTSLQAKEWRKAVYERDNYTCQDCGDNKGGNLEADHIKPWADFPELRFELSNGRTLCKPCHRKTPTWGSAHKQRQSSFVRDFILMS